MTEVQDDNYPEDRFVAAKIKNKEGEDFILYVCTVVTCYTTFHRICDSIFRGQCSLEKGVGRIAVACTRPMSRQVDIINL